MPITKGFWSFVNRGRPKDLNIMSERLSPDRRSFKQFLPSLFHHIGSRALGGSAGDRIDPQWLPELIQIRQEIKSERLDINAVIHRLVRLTQRVLGADGAGVWLFMSDEIFYSAGAGSASNDERLRLEVISKLANTWQLARNSPPRLGNPTGIVTVYETNYDPGWAMSLLVEPICRGHNVAGALSVLSDKLNAFAERDAATIHLLADVLAQALNKAEEAGLQESVALEPAAMLQLIEKIIPALRRMLENDADASQSKCRLPRSETEYELSAPCIDTELRRESPEADQELHTIEVTGGTRTVHDQASRSPIRHPATSPVLQETNVPGLGVPGALESEVVETSTLGAVLRQKYERQAAFVRNDISRTLAVLRIAGCWLFNRVDNAGHQVWHAARYQNNPLQGPVKAAYRSVQGMKASISSAARSAGNRVRSATAFRSKLPTVQSTRSLPTLWRTAPVVGILATATIFVILRTRFHNPAQTTVSGSRTTTQENNIPLSVGTLEYRETAQTDRDAKPRPREAYVTEPVGAGASLLVSHLQVTDRATKDALRALSPYELAGLRRRADFGDDSAAFQLGMAYEIGRGLPQSCTTAARWVARAAGEGNAAAQYNLGLRYREADGVPPNADVAAKWLRKAAAQQGSNARLALTAR
jgi:hypothetical protein